MIGAPAGDLDRIVTLFVVAPIAGALADRIGERPLLVGGLFGIAILVAVFAGAGSYASAEAFSDGFAPAIAVAAALSLVGALAGLGLPGRPQATETAPRPPRTVPALETEGGG